MDRYELVHQLLQWAVCISIKQNGFWLLNRPSLCSRIRRNSRWHDFSQCYSK